MLSRFEDVRAYIASQLRYSCDVISHARWSDEIVYLGSCAQLLSIAFESSQLNVNVLAIVF